MASKFLTPNEDASIGIPSTDTSNRFPTDILLRKRGFTIYSRPNKGEPIWERGGKLFTQSEAVQYRHARKGEEG